MLIDNVINTDYTHFTIMMIGEAMQGIDYLAGCVYHMIHFSNLPNILERRALLSKENVILEAITYQSIAFEDVQNLRDRIFVWDFSKQIFRSLHSYVPFYFATHTPMLYVQYRNRIQNEIVIFEVNRSILKQSGVLFTDGNASNQQLSKHSSEFVEIVPASIRRNTCRRRYQPGGPRGSNPNHTDFYSDTSFLDRLKWDILTDKWWHMDDERKRIKHAEVLVPDIVPLSWLTGITVSTPAMVRSVSNLISECGLTDRIPSVTCKPEMFF